MLRGLASLSLSLERLIEVHLSQLPSLSNSVPFRGGTSDIPVYASGSFIEPVANTLRPNKHASLLNQTSPSHTLESANRSLPLEA